MGKLALIFGLCFLTVGGLHAGVVPEFGYPDDMTDLGTGQLVRIGRVFRGDFLGNSVPGGFNRVDQGAGQTNGNGGVISGGAAAIPEPAAMLLIGSGLIAVALAHRRLRR
jgi:PEP-CTERM motif